MSTLEIDTGDLGPGEMAAVRSLWWLPVAMGVVAILFGFLVLSFTYTTVWAIAVWAGFGLVLVGIAELGAAMLFSGAARWIAVILGIVSVGAGIMAFVWPESTFLVLARLVGWVLLLRGTFDVIGSLNARARREEGWWLMLALGVLEIVVAVWAVRYPGRSIALLVLWVGISAVARGLALVFAGFAFRSHAAAA